MAANLGEAILKIRADVTGLRRDLGMAQGLVRSVLGASGLGQAAAGVFLISKGIELATSLVSNLAHGFYSVGQAIVSANDQIDRMQGALGVVLKSQVKASQLIADIRQFASETPFNTTGLIQQYQLLLNYGIEARKILPMLRAIGDAGAASPKGMEHTVHRIALAIGQIKSHGKLLGGELKQLAEAGIPAAEILKRHFRMSIQDIQKAVKSGAISIDDVIDALVRGMDERFGGTMAKIARTWGGMMERIRDKSLIALQQITQPLHELMKGGLAGVSGLFDSEGFSEFIKSARAGMETIVSLASHVSAILRPLGTQLVSSFQQLSPLVSEIIGRLAPLMNAGEMSFFALLKVGVIGATEAIRGLTAMLKSALEVMAIFAADWGKSWEILKLLAAATVLDISAEFQFLWDSITTGLKNAVTVMKNIFSAFATLVSDNLSIIANSVSVLMAALMKLKSAKLTELPQALVEFQHAVQDGVRNQQRSQFNAFQRFSRSMLGITSGTQAMPTREPGGQSLRDRAGQLFRELMGDRREQQRRETEQRNARMMRGGAQMAGGAAAQFGGLVQQGLAGVVQGLGAFFGGRERAEEKKAKAEFVGISELSKKIQQGLLNEDPAERQVRAIGLVGQGVRAVEGAVNNVVDAVRNWVPRAT